jgi:hypothetical protein
MTDEDSHLSTALANVSRELPIDVPVLVRVTPIQARVLSKAWEQHLDAKAGIVPETADNDKWSGAAVAAWVIIAAGVAIALGLLALSGPSGAAVLRGLGS